jgi:hypothetical protein
MSHDLMLIVALAVPAVLFIMLRVNAAMVFLSVCLGVVLVEFVAGQANEMIALFAPRINSVSRMTLELILLFLPAVATAIFTLFSVHGRVKVLLNAVPAVAASMLAVLMAVPLLPRGLRFALEGQPVWRMLSKSEALVVGLGALVSLFFLWSQRASFKHHDKRKH